MGWIIGYTLFLALTVFSKESFQIGIDIGDIPSCNGSSTWITSARVQCIATCVAKNLPMVRGCGVPSDGTLNSTLNCEGSSKSQDLEVETQTASLNATVAKEFGVVDSTTLENRTNEESEKINSTQESNVTGLFSGLQVLMTQTYAISMYGISERRSLAMLRSENESLDAIGVDYLYDDNLVFYISKNKIFRANIEGAVLNNSVEVVGTEGRPISVAVDWVHRQLYWLDDPHMSVMTSDLDGNNNKSMFGHLRFRFSWPNNIVVDPYDGSLFFVMYNAIYKSNLEGSKVETVLKKNDHVDGLETITLDKANKKIYFFGNKYFSYLLGRIDYDGTEEVYRFNIGSLGDLSWAMGMDVVGGTLYMAHKEAGREAPGKCRDSFQSININSTYGTAIQQLFRNENCSNPIWNTKIFHPCVQSPSCAEGALTTTPTPTSTPNPTPTPTSTSTPTPTPTSTPISTPTHATTPTPNPTPTPTPTPISTPTHTPTHTIIPTTTPTPTPTPTPTITPTPTPTTTTKLGQTPASTTKPITIVP